MNLAVILVVVFVLAYVLIAMENKININKSSVALLLCCLMWSLLSLFSTSIDPSLDHARISSDLLGALGSTCEILVFLIGAMTIVDIIDTHGGFEVITKHITTRKKTRLLWLLATITFLMSSVLDNMTTTIVMVNMTTTIVMVMLLRRMITNYKERWLFASIIVIAANCGGAWSPIGDVSTILLWMKGNVTSLDLMKSLIVPCLICLYIPVAIAARFLKGVIVEQQTNEEAAFRPAFISGRESRTILILGVVLLILVPVFKSVVGLPPYIGVMFALAIMWIYTDMMYKKKKEVAESLKNRVSKIIKQLDMPPRGSMRVSTTPTPSAPSSACSHPWSTTRLSWRPAWVCSPFPTPLPWLHPLTRPIFPTSLWTEHSGTCLHTAQVPAEASSSSAPPQVSWRWASRTSISSGISSTLACSPCSVTLPA